MIDQDEELSWDDGGTFFFMANPSLRAMVIYIKFFRDLYVFFLDMSRWCSWLSR